MNGYDNDKGPPNRGCCVVPGNGHGAAVEVEAAVALLGVPLVWCEVETSMLPRRGAHQGHFSRLG